MEQIKVQNLSFSYPGKLIPSLKSVSFTIHSGELVLLCGLSGCGKTTLLRHMKTILSPCGHRGGDVLFHGISIENIPLAEQAAKIGFVMQNPDSQIVTDKVWHELAFGLENLGIPQAIMRLRVGEMANYFGIQDWFHREIHELSGGQKQLVNLASVMALQPDILILDEPTSQLDPIAASDFLNTVKKINRELGTTVIITEHRTEDIFPAADRVIVLDSGSILADDKPDKVGEILHHKNHPMFAELPTAARVFYESEKSGISPLTVREGRNWLSHKTIVEQISIPSEISILKKEDTALTIKDVWFRYDRDGNDVLKNLNFRLRRGSFHAIMGGNGTGKSTTLKALCGLCRPYRGTIQILDKNISQYKHGSLFMNCLAMLPQDPQSLFVKETVEQELIEMCASSEQIEKVVCDCEIRDLLQAHPFDLSGGEQQRVALAKVLLTNPQILLLDEPTKGLDGSFKERFVQIIRSLQTRGISVLMVSHDIEFCAAYTDYVSLFFDGSILTTEAPERFFAYNSFYTTAANRMSRGILNNAITAEQILVGIGAGRR